MQPVAFFLLSLCCPQLLYMLVAFKSDSTATRVALALTVLPFFSPVSHRRPNKNPMHMFRNCNEKKTACPHPPLSDGRERETPAARIVYGVPLYVWHALAPGARCSVCPVRTTTKELFPSPLTRGCIRTCQFAERKNCAKTSAPSHTRQLLRRQRRGADPPLSAPAAPPAPRNLKWAPSQPLFVWVACTGEAELLWRSQAPGHTPTAKHTCTCTASAVCTTKFSFVGHADEGGHSGGGAEAAAAAAVAGVRGTRSQIFRIPMTDKKNRTQAGSCSA